MRGCSRAWMTEAGSWPPQRDGGRGGEAAAAGWRRRLRGRCGWRRRRTWECGGCGGGDADEICGRLGFLGYLRRMRMRCVYFYQATLLQLAASYNKLGVLS